MLPLLSYHRALYKMGTSKINYSVRRGATQCYRQGSSMNEYLQHPLTTATEKAWSSGGGTHLLHWNTVGQLDAVVNTDKPSRLELHCSFWFRSAVAKFSQSPWLYTPRGLDLLCGVSISFHAVQNAVILGYRVL